MSAASPFSVFEDSQRIARYDLTRTAFGLDLGSILLHKRADLRVGAIFGNARTKLDTGELPLPELNNSVRTPGSGPPISVWA